MDKEYTILHISDLHKSEEDSYEDLMESLRMDCETYEREGIKKPEIIVVSGDIAEGAEGLDADAIIERQYAEAASFLQQLTDYFLDGDKSRLIIVPGNHDVCRGISKEACVPSTNDRKEDYKVFRAGESSIRWSWNDFGFYKIADRDKYEQRFCHFVKFYNNFYGGLRILKEDCAKHGNVSEIGSHKIAFLMLNSGHNLDHLNDAGSIYPGAVTENGRELSKLNKKGYLLCAVWHHHISGLPTEHNYLDYRILTSLMRYNIQLGLFGHQHKSKVVQQFFDVAEEKEMILVSAGCLYGNVKQLPPDTPRQYNLISVKMHGQQVRLEVRTRKDQSEGQFSIPSWGHSNIGNSNREVIVKELSLPKPAVPPINDLINELDVKTRTSGDFMQGLRELVSMREENEIVESYIDDYIDNLKPENCFEVFDILGEIRSQRQAMYLLGAAKALRDKTFLELLKTMAFIKNSEDPMVRILRDE